MSNSELGMLIVLVLCVAFTVMTVVTADSRIIQERKVKDDYKRMYQQTYLKLLNCRSTEVTDIAEVLCNRSDVVNFMIDVKNDTQKFTLSGGGRSERIHNDSRISDC